MTVREQLHKKIDQLDDSALSKLAAALEDIEAGQGTNQNIEAQRIEETIALWEAFAEPMDDEEAEKEMFAAMERRPLFGGRKLEVDPD